MFNRFRDSRWHFTSLSHRSWDERRHWDQPPTQEWWSRYWFSVNTGSVKHQCDRPILERLLVFLLIWLMSLDWADKQSPIKIFSWEWILIRFGTFLNENLFLTTLKVSGWKRRARTSDIFNFQLLFWPSEYSFISFQPNFRHVSELRPQMAPKISIVVQKYWETLDKKSNRIYLETFQFKKFFFKLELWTTHCSN